MSMSKSGSVAVLSLSLLLFCSCGKKEEPEPEIRAIQYLKIGELATGNLRNFPGVIHAKDSSLVSFEDIGGKVRTVNVQIGERVAKGQILAVLDTEKFTLDLNDAQAEVKKAEAQMAKAQSDYKREQELFTRGASFQKKLDAVKYELDAAESNEKSAKAKLGLAERNLKNTELKAPYDGHVGKRLVEPNQIVNVGQGILEIDAEGSLEVHFDIPENLRKRVSVGMTGPVMFPGMTSPVARYRISYFGTAAGTANSFPAKAILIDPSAEVKPGMTAEVLLTLPIEQSASAGLLVPIKAVLPGKERGAGYVFVYDPGTSTLRKTQVEGFGMQDNFGIVKGDIKPGDIIATAGVGLLVDGQKVKLYEPDREEAGSAGGRP
jgi:RND family efflux transporter MFP subunit